MKLDLELIQYINLFEKVTRTKVRNCFYNKDGLVFIVNFGDCSKAIGKKAVNMRKLTRLINKKIKVVEYNKDPVRFINNFTSSVKLENIELKDDEITLKVKSLKDKGLLIGRNGKNLEETKKVMDYYFNIKKIKII